VNKVFLPFLAALFALFGGVKKKAEKHPKAIKQAGIQSTKRRRKQVKNGGRRTSRIKAWRQISFAKPKTSHGNAVRWGFGFGIKRQFGDSFLSTKKQVF